MTGSTPTAVPAAITTVAAPVEARLRSILEAERARWVAIDADLAAPLDVLTRFVLDGGKRLRPAFCHWAFVGAGGAPGDSGVIDAGAAFEMLHAFALIHDDVMDGSSTRRGESTVHVTFDADHQESAWSGEARRFGEGIAILVGDLAEVYADRLMSNAPTAAFEVWNELKIELNIGQFLDVLGAARGGVDLQTARRIVRYKSGKYTIERPMHVGAALAGRLDELEEPLSRYGEPLGEAFQLRDDILGTFGDSARTGKPVGDDLRERKPTPLLAIALESATPPQLQILKRIGSLDLSHDEILEIQSVFTDTGALAEIELSISQLTVQAINTLEMIDITTEASDALEELAIYVGTRDF
ncbi:MAG: polyprenyl synthetase family protein [Actinobacteria bacterium]|nr:polyprenyl synthetase family protein [Actinomycetota bacterium]